MKNQQGDITDITNSNGEVIASYDYDPWGNVLSVSGDAEIGNLNPFRYKDYYYDSDIQMYYLQSRYYDADVGRFINCDDVNYIGTSESEVSYNPFAYCENNPINSEDSSGYLGKHWWNSVKWVGRILDAIIIAASLVSSYMSFKALKTFLKRHKNKILYQVRGQIIKYFGWSAASVLSSVLNIALTLLGTSIGDLIAKALDYADPWLNRKYKRNNGYILN